MGFKIEEHRELTQVTTRQDTALGIMRWGENNSFPQTFKNLCEQSPIAKPAIKRTAKFYVGAGFEGEDEIVSSYGLTLKDVVKVIADDYALLEGFAILCDYNLEGRVTGITPYRITDLRFNELDDLDLANKIGYFSNFGLNDEVRKTVTNHPTRAKIKWFDRFNPTVVLEQIETEGINDFKGQMLYYSNAGHSMYPIPPLQASINYVLADIENSILVRKETATGFINTFIMKTVMDSEDPTLIALEDAIDRSQGARGSGKVITFAGLSPDEVNSTLLEELGSGGSGAKAIIESAAASYELSQKPIHGAYLIPPILAGADQQTGFSSDDLEDGYKVFNAITQEGRDIIESQLNKILANSVFDTKSISIKRLKFDKEETLNEDGGGLVEEGGDNV